MAELTETNHIVKVRYTHQAMIDLIIAHPMIAQKEIAAHFGYTEAWISRIFCSDGFREMLEKRKGELVDPLIMQSVENQMEALCKQSMEVLARKLELPNASGDLAVKTFEATARAKGYGVAKQSPVNVSFVVAMPPKAVDGESWTAEHSPRVVNG